MAKNFSLAGLEKILWGNWTEKANYSLADVPGAFTRVYGLQTTSSPSAVNHDDNSSNVIPLYCSLLGLVVLGLLIYVIVRQWRIRKRKGQIPVPSSDPEAPRPQGSDSGVFLENGEAKNGPITSSTKVRDLPSGLRKILESELNRPREESGSWAALAGELGFNNSRVSSFEVKSEQDQKTPVKHLIHEWSKSENATVGTLVRALNKIGRQDIAKQFPAVSEPGSANCSPRKAENSSIHSGSVHSGHGSGHGSVHGSAHGSAHGSVHGSAHGSVHGSAHGSAHGSGAGSAHITQNQDRV